jgi:hypothetical protein
MGSLPITNPLGLPTHLAFPVVQVASDAVVKRGTMHGGVSACGVLLLSDRYGDFPIPCVAGLPGHNGVRRGAFDPNRAIAFGVLTECVHGEIEVFD